MGNTTVKSNPNHGKKSSASGSVFSKIGALILLILAILLLVHLGKSLHQSSVNKAAVSEGRQILQTLAAVSVSDIEEQIKVDRRAAMKQEFEEKVEQEDFSISSAYEDAVICGDSRAVGISLYGVLDESHVLADIGASITKLKNDEDTLETINPTMMFLCYGLNDILNYGYDNADSWVSDYKDIILELKERLPSTQICVDSILPTLSGATVDEYAIEDYNTALKKMCDEIHVQYIDSTVLLMDEDGNPINTEYYESDNEHFTKAFLEPWLTQMMSEAYSYDVYGETDSSFDSSNNESTEETTDEETE